MEVSQKVPLISSIFYLDKIVQRTRKDPYSVLYAGKCALDRGLSPPHGGYYMHAGSIFQPIPVQKDQGL